MEVGNVTRNGQRLASAAALPGLKDPKRRRESTGQGCRATHGSRATVQNDHHRP